MEPKSSSSPRTTYTRRHSGKLLAGLLLLLVVIPYIQVYSHQFVNWDDPDYIVRNPMVANGLSWAGISWAFSSFHAANWHPLTWISLMLDVTLFGTNPTAIHLINVAWHLLNSVVVFILFMKLGASRSAAFLMALFFGVHPLRVESVAWASERKDLLCAFFFLAAWVSHLRYLRRPGFCSYAGTTALFVLALLSKPMAITWPLIPFIHDIWPDRRAAGLKERMLEKIPWIALSIISGVVTLQAQKAGNAVNSLAVLPLADRIANAGISYLTYLQETIWPVDLTAFYPYAQEIRMPHAVGAWSALILVTLVVTWQRRLRPFLFFGWSIFIVTLLPVIGIVQVGIQAHADRYMYLPQTGLILAAGLWADQGVKGRIPRLLAGGVTGLIVCILSGLTLRQVGYWKDTETLFTQNIRVVGENDQAHYNLGTDYSERKQTEKALYHFIKASQPHPGDAEINNNLANAYFQAKRYDDAVAAFRKALQARPDNPIILVNLGNCYLEMQELDSAEDCYRRAIRQDPYLANAYYGQGDEHFKRGEFEKAAKAYDMVLQIDPGWTEVVPLRDSARQRAANELNRQTR